MRIFKTTLTTITIVMRSEPLKRQSQQMPSALLFAEIVLEASLTNSVGLDQTAPEV